MKTPRVISPTLLLPTKEDIYNLGKIETPNIFDASGRSFDDKGLYSKTIFGVPGTENRVTAFGYISLNVAVIHPLIFDILVDLAELHIKIMEGKSYAIFNTETKSFEPTDQVHGETGYTFFLRHLHELRPQRNTAKKRNKKIDLLERQMGRDIDSLKELDGEVTFKYLYVSPAGLRDYELSESGTHTEDEINDLYRSVLNTANLLFNIDEKVLNTPVMDRTRLKLQTNVNAVYNYIMTLLDGKNKFLLGNWYKRGIEYSTRNVITGNPYLIEDLDNTDDFPNIDHTMIGLYQTMNGLSPFVRKNLNDMFMSNIFSGFSNVVTIIDPKTYKRTSIEIKNEERDRWFTVDGIERTLVKLIDDNMKNYPVSIGGGYVCMVRNKADTVELIVNCDDVEDKEELRPITYGEMFYIAVSGTPKFNTNTRYPITGERSIYLSKTWVLTTTDAKKKTIHSKDIPQIDGVGVKNYPGTGTWINTMSPHYTKLEGLGADFDGDKENVIFLMTNQAQEEIEAILDNVGNFVSADGTPLQSPCDNVSEYVAAAMTKKYY